MPLVYESSSFAISSRLWGRTFLIHQTEPRKTNLIVYVYGTLSIKLRVVWTLSTEKESYTGISNLKTVRQPHTLPNQLVLFCSYTRLWKITDFGLTSEGTNFKIYSTPGASGTEGYRGPELVQEDSCFSKQSDIFALGCILYELATGKKAFSNDTSVFNFRAIGQPPEIPQISVKPRVWTYLSQLITAMLQISWWQRPSACDILKVMNFLHDDSTSVEVPALSLPLRSLKFPADFFSDSTSMVIESNSLLWDSIIWRPYW
jgi:serine/threonine protein kinase